MTDYDGRTGPSGPAIGRTVTTAEGRVGVQKLSVGPMDNNAYLLTALDLPSPRPAVLIDAAAEPDRIAHQLADVDLQVVVTTHRHADHWQALAEVATSTSAATMAGADDADAIDVPIARRLAHGDTVQVGPIELGVLHTPGHTPGSVCLLLRAEGEWTHHLFTGDTLFPGGPGNTFGDPDAFATIMTSLREQVFALPDDTWVYPGHGDDTSLAAERDQLSKWRERGW
jgi:glyoxylase-like metal-dependent hydrolase (beta-lactamase superfamily II)